MGSGRKSLPISSGGSGGLRDSGSQYRSGSGGIRGIMENLSQHQDVSGQVSMLSTLLCCVQYAQSHPDAEAGLMLMGEVVVACKQEFCLLGTHHTLPVTLHGMHGKSQNVWHDDMAPSHRRPGRGLCSGIAARQQPVDAWDNATGTKRAWTSQGLPRAPALPRGLLQS